jgi:hypothetical protein
MANIPVQDSKDGGIPTFQAASADGDTFSNDGQVFLRVISPSGTETKVILQNGRECEFGAHPAYELVSPVGQNQLESSRLSTYRFNSNGIASITYSPNVIGVQIAALRHSLQNKDVIS